MARRAPKDEKPYNPIEAELVKRATGFRRGELEQRDERREAEPPLQVSSVRVEEPSARAESGVVGVVGVAESSVFEVSRRGGREKRVILSWEDEVAIDDLLSQLSQDLRTPVKLSNALRSCVMLLRHAEELIRRQAKKASTFSRPPNNDQTAIAYFEHRLAKLFQAGIKDSSTL